MLTIAIVMVWVFMAATLALIGCVSTVGQNSRYWDIRAITLPASIIASVATALIGLSALCQLSTWSFDQQFRLMIIVVAIADLVGCSLGAIRVGLPKSRVGRLLKWTRVLS